jgi:ABC-type molybdate transport system substrate-binding protein
MNKRNLIVGSDFESDTLLEHVLNPKTRVGAGTPVDDPLGDYTQQVFQRAEAVSKGSFRVLTEKTRPLIGGRERSLPVPEGKHPILYFLSAAREIDVLFIYCANAGWFLGEGPGLRLVQLPPELDVEATFGITVLSQGSMDANRLAMRHTSLEANKR